MPSSALVGILPVKISHIELSRGLFENVSLQSRAGMQGSPPSPNPCQLVK